MTAPVLNTHIGGVFTGGTTQSVILPTITAGDIVVVAVCVELSGTLRTVSGVSATGLTFAKRAAYQFTSDTGTGIEVWWALAAGGATNRSISVTVNLAPDDWAIHAFSVSGCDPTTPWDTNASLPAKQSYTTGNPSLSCNTDHPNTLIFGVWCSPSGGTDSTGAESTLIEARSTAGGSRFIHSRSEYHTHTTVQTGVATTIGVAPENSGMVVDALTSDSNSRAAVMAQTVLAFTETLTGSVTGAMVAAQTVPVFPQTLGVLPVRYADIAQPVPVFSQSMVMAAPAHLVIGQMVPVFTNALAAVLPIKAALSQTINPFTVRITATPNFRSAAILSNVRTRPGTMRAEPRPRRVK